MFAGTAEAHLLSGLPDNQIYLFYGLFNLFVLVMILLDLFVFMGRLREVPYMWPDFPVFHVVNTMQYVWRMVALM